MAELFKSELQASFLFQVRMNEYTPCSVELQAALPSKARAPFSLGRSARLNISVVKSIQWDSCTPWHSASVLECGSCSVIKQHHTGRVYVRVSVRVCNAAAHLSFDSCYCWRCCVIAHLLGVFRFQHTVVEYVVRPTCFMTATILWKTRSVTAMKWFCWCS